MVRSADEVEAVGYLNLSPSTRPFISIAVNPIRSFMEKSRSAVS